MSHSPEVKGLAFRVESVGFRVWGSGFKVWGLGFRLCHSPESKDG